MNQNLQRNIRNNNMSLTNKKGPKKRSPIPLFILLGVFIICFILYAVQFFGNSSSDNPSETTAPSTTAPETTAPETTTPETTAPVTTDPVVSSTEGKIDPPPSYAYTVVLDPGHGFGDGGTSSEYLGELTEKDLTLDMCQRIAEILQKSNIKVLFTHDGKTFPKVSELDNRAKAAGFSMKNYAAELIQAFGVDKNGNPVDAKATWDTFSKNLSDSGNGANLFNVYERAYYINILSKEEPVDMMLSVHVNSVDISDPKVDLNKFSGYTVSYCSANESANQSLLLQKQVSDALHAAFSDKKVVLYSDPWYDSFVITKYCGVPSVLVETGYCVREDEGKQLADPAFRQKMAETLAGAVIKYLSQTT